MHDIGQFGLLDGEVGGWTSDRRDRRKRVETFSDGKKFNRLAKDVTPVVKPSPFPLRGGWRFPNRSRGIIHAGPRRSPRMTREGAGTGECGGAFIPTLRVRPVFSVPMKGKLPIE
jgi:hypothetical protein